MVICLIPGDGDPDHMVKVVSASFLFYNVIFFLVINKLLGEDMVQEVFDFSL